MKQVTIANLEILVDEADKVIHIEEATDIPQGFEQEVTALYPGYEVWFMYHKATAPTERLREIALLLDDCIDMRLHPSEFKPYDTADAFRVISESDFEIFSSLHDKNSEDMFWTSQLIRENLSKWGVFLSRPNTPAAGYAIIFTKMANPKIGEVFYLQAHDPAQSRALLTAAVEYAFDVGNTEIVYMTDKDKSPKGANEQETAQSLGFRKKGVYQGYMLKVREKLSPQEILANEENLICNCPDTKCKWHGICKDCLALHRYHATIPNCLEIEIERKIGVSVDFINDRP